MAKAIPFDPAVKAADPRVEGSCQTTDYTQHLTLIGGSEAHKLRIRIHTDTHVDQAWGRVDRWDGRQWQQVINMRGDALAIDKGIGYVRDRSVACYEDDRNRLLALAREVLG